MELKDIIKTTNIIKIAPDKSLSSALSQLRSSHDAAFIFTGNKKYLGLINPYYSIIKTSLPGNAKVEHCVFHAPHVKISYSIGKVAQLMIESKVHYLPVFDENEKFLGIVSARHMLASFRDAEIFNIPIREFLKRKGSPLLTVYDTDIVSFAVNLFKTRKISKLIVLNKSMKLVGILTYYDLINYLITPKVKSHRGDRKGSRGTFHYQQVKNFAKSQVLTLRAKDTLNDALGLILDKQIGSVVIVDEKKNPIGIITTRDFLKILTHQRKERTIEVTAKNLSQASKMALEGFLSQLAFWIKKIPDVQGIRLFVKEEKQGGVFKTVLALIPKRGPLKVIKTEGKNLFDVMKDTIKRLKL